MGIFSRLGTLIKSNLNDLIARAEDPEKMLNQVVLEMKNQLVRNVNAKTKVISTRTNSGAVMGRNNAPMGGCPNKAA